jgi:phosphoenolpyruvate carboxylase
MSEIVLYTARIQEAMRYDKLSASDYRLVMTIMHAVSQGLTEEQWKEEQDKTIRILTNQLPDEVRLHVDTANRYEQTVACFKDLVLWPW